MLKKPLIIYILQASIALCVSLHQLPPAGQNEDISFPDYICSFKKEGNDEDAVAFNEMLEHAEREALNEANNINLAQSFEKKYYRISQGVAQEKVQCINTSGIDANEQEWVGKRASKALINLKDYIGRSNLDLPKNQLEKMTEKDMPRISLLLSGGGLRAMLDGAGFIKAADIRTSPNEGFGGILQSSIYLMALSGGSWALGSLISNNFPTIEELKKKQWNLSLDLTRYDPSEPTEYSITYYSHIMKNLVKKRYYGFPLCASDIWSQVINTVTHPDDESYCISDVQDAPWFQKQDFPFPIIESILEVSEHPTDQNITSPVIELTPFAFRSDDPSIKASVPMKYIGSHFVNGTLLKGSQAIFGYDVLSYVLASSSMMFAALPKILTNRYLKSMITWIMESNHHALEVSFWPNVFQGFKHSPVPDTDTILGLQDGGYNHINAPYISALEPSRKSDIFFVAESESNTDDMLHMTYYPSGESIVAAYTRATELVKNKTVNPMPFVPTEKELQAGDLLKRVVFFGVEDDADINSPVVVHMPNFEKSSPSNTSTTKSQYTDQERDLQIQNFADIASNMEKIGGEWSQCISCAIIERWRRRNGFERTDTCTKCFVKHSYNHKV